MTKFTGRRMGAAVLVLSFLVLSFLTPKTAYGAKAFDVDTTGTLTTSLLSWWNEEDNADEYSTRNWTDTNVSYVSGKIGNGASFNGTSSYQRLSSVVFNSLPFSVSFWFKPDISYPTSTPASLFLQGGDPGAGAASPAIYIGSNSSAYEGNGGIRIYVYNGGNQPDAISSTTSWTAGTWYHVVATVNSSGQAKLYVNGADVTVQKTEGTSSLQWNTNTYVGASAPYSSEYFDGTKDLVGTWNKVLSSTEIANLYNAGGGNAYRNQSSPSQITGYGTTTNRLAKFTSTTIIANSLLLDDGVDITLTSGNLFLQAGKAIDTVVSGILNIGTSIANAVNIGRAGITTTINGLLSWTSMATVSNCNSTSSPASCGSAPAGSVALPVSATTLIVSSTAITANSQVLVTEDFSLGSRLGVTCNTTDNRTYRISARTAGANFSIVSDRTPTTNPACLSYLIVN